VETGESTVLFDTGGNGSILLSNMGQMDVDPGTIDAVVLSHEHGDHTNGLSGLLDQGISPPVYVPAEFAPSFKDRVRARTELIEVSAPTEVLPGVYATGRVGSGIVEQALVVETADGTVVVTGCAHPGVVAMVRRAKEILPGEVALVMGGFHLGDASPSDVEGIIADFCQLDVRQVAPCHCTGDRARGIFSKAYGEEYFAAGVGWVMSIKPLEEEG
jgi:7,8-dihydropterin-6-yl-methyl-4-(beta-D-ribofuranosyl)aminobenzene 5'-phosphate synthase